MQLRTTDEYSQRERDLVRRVAELTEEVERLRASVSQVYIYFYSIVVCFENCAKYTFFAFAAFD